MRYQNACDQIREILASRTQAQPILEAKDVWRLLKCDSAPSLRSVRRYMEDIRKDLGHGGQPSQFGHRGQIIRTNN